MGVCVIHICLESRTSGLGLETFHSHAVPPDTESVCSLHERTGMSKSLSETVCKQNMEH